MRPKPKIFICAGVCKLACGLLIRWRFTTIMDLSGKQKGKVKFWSLPKDIFCKGCLK